MWILKCFFNIYDVGVICCIKVEVEISKMFVCGILDKIVRCLDIIFWWGDKWL